jgi:NitT/TauT family transport system substrate-binding protein
MPRTAVILCGGSSPRLPLLAREDGEDVQSKRWQVLGVTALCALATTTGCGSGDAGSGGGEGGEGVTTLRVASNGNTSALPLWVAIEENLCEPHGLVIFTTPVQAISAAAQGIPVTEIAGSSLDTAENANSYLMVGEGSPIDGVEDMEGATIGVLTEVGTLHYATLLLLKQAGVDPSSVEIVQIDGPAMADQLAAGRVDAVEAVRPFNKSVEAAGGTNIDTPFSSLADDISVIWWGANRPWAEENPDTVQAYQDCLEDGIQYIADNEAEARTVMQEYTDLPAEVAENFELPAYDASVRPQDIEKWLGAMRELDLFDGDVDPEQLAFQP